MATYILVHGSWHGAWCWYKVSSRLKSLGHTVIIPDLPGRIKNPKVIPALVSLNVMVKTVTDILDGLSEKAIIVVHSRNGMVVSQAAELRPKTIDKIFYLAAFMLKSGERAADYFFSDNESKLKGNVIINRLKMTDMIKETVYQTALYHDCNSDDVELAHALLTPEPSRPALTRVRLTEAGYGSVPRYYIELTRDQAVSINLQRRFLSQQKVDGIFTIEASHSAYFSQPDKLVEIVTKSPSPHP